MISPLKRVTPMMIAWSLAFLLAASVAPAFAQSQPAESAAKVVVGTMRAPPFVLRGDDGLWHGLSVDLWSQIATELRKDFEFREFDYDPVGLLLAVERREIDLAIGAIPVTLEGEARFDFSHPYFAAGLGIAVRSEPQRGLLATLTSFVTPQLLGTIAALLALLLCVGTIIWTLERSQAAGHFDRRPVHGIGDGMWWAAVTMTTTGYGDKVPVGWSGRVVGLIWMFASIFLTALFSATLASSLVVNRLKASVTSPADLPRARVAVVTGTAGELWLKAQGVQGREYPFVIQASKALQRGDVEALVYERAVLGHMIKQYGWREIEILPHVLAVHDYAIAMQADSPMKESVNRALLKTVHAPQWKSVVQRYVGSLENAPDRP